MPPNRILHRLLPAVVAAALGLALTASSGIIAPVSAEAAGYAKPSGLKASAVSSTAIALTWKAVRNAPAYRVQFSATSSMGDAQTMDVTTNSLDWNYLNPQPSTGKPWVRLKPSTKYYFRVKVISRTDLSHDPKTLSSYSAKLTVKTSPASSWFALPPSGLRATVQSPTSEYLSWASRGPGVLYRLTYATSADLTADAATATFSASGGVLSGLRAGTKYYYRVRVISAGSNAGGLSAASATSSFTTATTSTAPSTPFKVATYNICSEAPGCWKYAGWSTRLGLLAGNVAAQAPDLLSMQESNRAGDLIEELNDNHRCGADQCSYELASDTAHANLAYNSARFSLDAADDGNNNGDNDGDDPTPTPEPTGEHTWSNDSNKNVVWATFTDKVTGKRIFVAAPHFSNGDTTAEQNERITQAQELVDLVIANNVDKLPVIVTGDFNTSKRKPHHGDVYSTMIGAGYADSLGNPTDSRYPDAAALATHRIDVGYATANNYTNPAPRSKWLNGYDIDYVWHTSGIGVDMIQTVVSLDLDGKFIGSTANGAAVGYPPSDHNMLTAWVHLS